MARGGKKPGAGRPKGSYTKPRISDDLTPKQIKDLLEKAKELAMAGDSVLMKFLLEQVYGKAQQSIELDGRVQIEGVTISVRE